MYLSHLGIEHLLFKGDHMTRTGIKKTGVLATMLIAFCLFMLRAPLVHADVLQCQLTYNTQSTFMPPSSGVHNFLIFLDDSAKSVQVQGVNPQVEVEVTTYTDETIKFTLRSPKEMKGSSEVTYDIDRTSGFTLYRGVVKVVGSMSEGMTVTEARGFCK